MGTIQLTLDTRCIREEGDALIFSVSLTTSFKDEEFAPLSRESLLPWNLLGHMDKDKDEYVQWFAYDTNGSKVDPGITINAVRSGVVVPVSGIRSHIEDVLGKFSPVGLTAVHAGTHKEIEITEASDLPGAEAGAWSAYLENWNTEPAPIAAQTLRSSFVLRVEGKGANGIAFLLPGVQIDSEKFVPRSEATLTDGDVAQFDPETAKGGKSTVTWLSAKASTGSPSIPGFLNITGFGTREAHGDVWSGVATAINPFSLLDAAISPSENQGGLLGRALKGLQSWCVSYAHFVLGPGLITHAPPSDATSIDGYSLAAILAGRSAGNLEHFLKAHEEWTRDDDPLARLKERFASLGDWKAKEWGDEQTCAAKELEILLAHLAPLREALQDAAGYATYLRQVNKGSLSHELSGDAMLARRRLDAIGASFGLQEAALSKARQALSNGTTQEIRGAVIDSLGDHFAGFANVDAGWLKKTMERVWLPASSLVAANTPTLVHRDECGVVVNFEPPQSIPNLAGVGLLVRQSGAGNWRCPMVATFARSGDDASAPSGDVLVPKRIEESEGLTNLSIRYRERPIGIRTPWDDDLADAKAPDSDASSAGFTLRPGVGQLAKLPELGYGRTFDFAAFEVDNSGVVPAAIGDDSMVFLKTDSTKWGVPDNAFKRVKIVRGEGVGALRMTSANERMDAHPCFQLAARFADDLYMSGHSTAPSSDSPENIHRALLVHVPDQEEFKLKEEWKDSTGLSLSVRRPFVPFEVWRRWTASDEWPARKEWGQLISEAEFIQDAEQPDAGHSGAAKTSSRRGLEDPAVVGVSVVITELVSQKVCLSKYLPFGVSQPDQGPGDDLKEHPLKVYEALAANAITLTLGISETRDASFEGNVFKLPPGSLYEIRLYSCICKKCDDRMDGSLLGEEVAESSARRLKAHTILQVEVAHTENTKIPDIVVDYTDVGKNDARKVCARINVVDTGHKDIARTVRAFEYSWQTFVWSGRHLPDVPRDVPMNHEKLVRWEALAFLGRELDRNFPNRVAYRGGAVIEEIELPNDARERYLRMRVRARHRYENIYRHVLSRFPESVMGPAEFKRHLNIADTRIDDPYLRVRVPGQLRDDQEVPPPVIKVVIPLPSQASEASGVCAQLLVVMNEAIGHIGGLAESVEFHVDSAEAASGTVLEFGSDPIAARIGRKSAATLDPKDALNKVAHVGLTFDTDTAEPRISSSCFIVNVPNDAKPFDFVKVVAKRTLLSISRGATGERDGRRSSDRALVRVSKASNPVWVPISPSDSCVLSKEAGWVALGKDARAMISSDALQLTDDDGAPIPWTGEKDAKVGGEELQGIFHVACIFRRVQSADGLDGGMELVKVVSDPQSKCQLLSEPAFVRFLTLRKSMRAGIEEARIDTAEQLFDALCPGDRDGYGSEPTLQFLGTSREIPFRR